MSEFHPDSRLDREREATNSALFVQLVRGHGHMAMMFLGQLENPQTGRREEPEPLGAKIFIDQLEMLMVKTQGNLTAEETILLEQTLAQAQGAFIKVVEELPQGEDGSAGV